MLAPLRLCPPDSCLRDLQRISVSSMCIYRFPICTILASNYEIRTLWKRVGIGASDIPHTHKSLFNHSRGPSAGFGGPTCSLRGLDFCYVGSWEPRLQIPCSLLLVSTAMLRVRMNQKLIRQTKANTLSLVSKQGVRLGAIGIWSDSR